MAKQKRKTLPKDFKELLASGNLETLKAVFDSCDVDARGGYSKQTALAFNECPDEFTRWLVERGADLSATDDYGETPLHSRAGHWQVRVEILIELGADVNHDAGGRGSPLHRTAAVGNIRTARALLNNGARTYATNDNGQTPLAFALELCPNSDIASMAPMAELLLAAMSIAPDKPRSLLSRFFSRSAPTSPVTPEMKRLVQKIGTDFEFHRAGYNPETVGAASDALDRLYSLFDVPPVPRRAMHDSQSSIAATPGRWEDQHQELWELLVPSSGAARTVQGEVIRISGRIHDELERNGGVNWDSDYRKMADAFLDHLTSGHQLPEPEFGQAREIVADVKRRQGDTAELCKLAVSWVALNPKPIALSEPDYKR